MRRLWAWIRGWFGRRPTTVVTWTPRRPDAVVHLSTLLHESQERHRLALQDLVTLREERDRLAVALKAEHDRWLGMPTEPPVAEAIVVEYPQASDVKPTPIGVDPIEVDPIVDASSEIVAMLFKVLDNPPAEKELPTEMWEPFVSLLKAYTMAGTQPKDDVVVIRNNILVSKLPEWCRAQVASALALEVGTVN